MRKYKYSKNKYKTSKNKKVKRKTSRNKKVKRNTFKYKSKKKKIHKGGVDQSVDVSVNGPTPQYVLDKLLSEQTCRKGSCGQWLAETNMKTPFQMPKYGPSLEKSVSYEVDRTTTKNESSTLFNLMYTVFSPTQEILIVKFSYELYTQDEYIYLKEIEKKDVRTYKTYKDRQKIPVPEYFKNIGMKILCSEIAWLLYKNHIRTYWDILLEAVPGERSWNVEFLMAKLKAYYSTYGFEDVRDKRYSEIIPNLESTNNIMIVNISQFIKKCKNNKIDMGGY
tara:strand:+ start:30 stop:866 length:837 start_codon:yes stop_codon:yes gene_type:complete